VLDVLFDPYNVPFWLLIIAILLGAIAIIARPFSTYVKFVYPNAKFEAMGNPFIGDKELDSVAESKDIISFKETINTLKDYNVAGETMYSLQQSLDDSFLATVDMMQKDSSKKMKEFFEVYLEKQDMPLLKNVLKNKILGNTISKDAAEKALTPQGHMLLETIIEAETTELPTLLKKHGYGEDVTSVLSDLHDFTELDIALDKHYITKLLQITVPYKCESAKQHYAKSLIDTIHIKNVLRAKQLGYNEERCKKMFMLEGREIPQWKYNELSECDGVAQIITNLEGTSYYTACKDAIEAYNTTNSVQVFEIALDSAFLKNIKDISIQNYSTIGPTLRFLVSKEFEIRNLKIIAKGVDEHIQPAVIKRYLVKEAAA